MLLVSRFHAVPKQRGLLDLISVSHTETAGSALNLRVFAGHAKTRRHSLTMDLFLTKDFPVHPVPEAYRAITPGTYLANFLGWRVSMLLG